MSSTTDQPTDSQADKRLFLLDGMALIYRAHFALIRSPRYTSSGFCTSAVFGFCNTILDIINREQPTHIAVAFDTDDATHRHEAFEDYKAQRQAMPEELTAQVPYIDRLLEALRIPVIRIPGFEADDVLGTLAKQAATKCFETYLVTPDKDFHQLVSENVFIWKPGRQGSSFEILRVPEVLDRWKVQDVGQVIDILGLMGDSSDNIPGIPGIGEKTAQKLIEKYGSVEQLLENVDQLKGKQKERIETHAEQARLSRMLATIITDVPHDIQLDNLAINKYDEKRLRELFVELEFDSLGKRLFGRNFTANKARAATIRHRREQEIQTRLFDEPVSEVKRLADVPHKYRRLDTREDRLALIETLGRQSAFCFDTEATSLDPRTASPVGIAFCCEPAEASFVTLPADREDAAEVLQEFAQLFSNSHIEKIGHNLKYDLTLLKWLGLDVHGTLMDTMLAHSMKEPEMNHGLDYLSKVYLGYQPISLTDLIGPKGNDQKSIREVPIDQLVDYACEDVDTALQINRILRPEIEERGVSKVCYEVECPLIPVLVDMEHEGIRVDIKALANYSEHLAAEIELLRERIFSAAGRSFNIDSPKQLGEVLYDELRVEEKPKKTPTGQYSTREAELIRLSGQHQIVRDVLEYRNAMKLKTVYLDQLPAAVNPQTGRIHTNYSQTWTATGRMQSNNPNLQTIPVRKERGREIRAAFVPRDDNYKILSADYSQVELRIMAELSQDEAMLEAFESNTDIHAATASKVYKVSLDEVTREMRDKAKTVNFGIIYGISAFGLQQRLNIPRNEASQLIDSYFEKHPGVQAYIDRTIAFGREHGFVKTLTGRRRYLRDIDSRNRSLRSTAERLAMNSPIQGTAADLLKLAMVRVHHLLQSGEHKTKMLLTVHDELVFDLHNDEHNLIQEIVDAMRTALPIRVPLVVETGVGKNWLEAH